jgi:hypothetical protein
MAPRPTAERPPSGLNSYWTHVWDLGLEVLKEQGTWAWELKPLLDEYVFALRAAEATRDGFEWLEALNKYAGVNSDEMPDIAWSVLGQVASGLPTQWDRHTKRASALADQLALTPRGRKAIGLARSDDEAAEGDPLAELDELAERRATRS